MTRGRMFLRREKPYDRESCLEAAATCKPQCNRRLTPINADPNNT
ncbi:MAG TPA: hypothetical protein VI728_04920 [Syntrophales bacterium]|nr:hypothetical protein [Syntrophales bacterium]